MNKFEELCQGITDYERNRLADDWFIHSYEMWEGVTFDEIISDVAKFGLNERSYSTKYEIMERVVQYFTFSFGDVDGRERLHKTSDALKVLDERLNLNLHYFVFGDKTADQIADEWEEEERLEKEEEERQACIDFCANFIYNDGLVDSLDEAYDLANMAV